jgi:hypothetical protein
MKDVEEIGDLKSKLDNVEQRLKTLESDMLCKHKKALLGQLAFCTERLILEHIYSSPLDRSKAKFKLIDINEDTSLSKEQDEKWKKIVQQTIHFNYFLDTMNLVKSGRLEDAHPETNLDRTEVTDSDITPYHPIFQRGL